MSYGPTTPITDPETHQGLMTLVLPPAEPFLKSLAAEIVAEKKADAIAEFQQDKKDQRALSDLPPEAALEYVKSHNQGWSNLTDVNRAQHLVDEKLAHQKGEQEQAPTGYAITSTAMDPNPRKQPDKEKEAKGKLDPLAFIA